MIFSLAKAVLLMTSAASARVKAASGSKLLPFKYSRSPVCRAARIERAAQLFFGTSGKGIAATINGSVNPANLEMTEIA